MILLGVLAYVSLQVVFGLYASRRVRSEEDYLLAGRAIRPALATFTIFATWFGAETCVGAAAQAYSGGLSAVAVEPFGYGTCLLLMVPTSILWAAAQIRACGQILAATSDVEVEIAVALAAGGLELAHPEQLLVKLAENMLPTALFIVFAGALVSAILSTVDSALLVSGSLIAHNLVLRVWPTSDQRRRVLVNRIAVVASGVVAYGLTLSHRSVWALVIEASGFGSAGIFVAV